MSSLGRKALKKTLERLKKDATRNLDRCVTMFEETQDDYDKLSTGQKKLYERIFRSTMPAVGSAIRYIQALEDYGYELDDAWDKLLRTVEQTDKTKSTEEKPSYRV